MQDYQKAFIQFALANDVLKFGEFTLKSGRNSPYFFNAGEFKTGHSLAKLGQFYAAAIEQANLKFDMLFGPAYKGIPLACTTAIALAEHHDQDKPYAFNRKEIKDHGEGGQIVGSKLTGRVLLVDDVITAGTAFREAVSFVEQAGAQLAGIVIAIDRQERGLDDRYAIEEIEQEYQIPIISVIQLADLVKFISHDSQYSGHLPKIQQYQGRYGISVFSLNKGNSHSRWTT